MDVSDFDLGDDDDDDGLAGLIDQGLDGYGGFRYINGELYAEKVPLSIIAESVGTPSYVYSRQSLTRAWRKLEEAFATIPAKHRSVRMCYAVKANSNQAVITTLARLGAGADVVSLGELERALAAGIPPEKIVFSGVGKTAGEIHRALSLGISQLNIESEPELRAVSEIATSMGVLAPIAIRINPDVDAKTHEKITTGRKDNKFGIDIDQAAEIYQLAASLPGLTVQGIAVPAFKGIGMKHLQALLRQHLRAVARLSIDQIAVVTVPGQLKALPEVHGVDEVQRAVAGFDNAPVDQHFATQQVETRHAPGHDFDALIARAVADFFRRHVLLDFAEQRRVAIPAVEIREQNVRRDRKNF